jgi:glutamyl endopeptidase
VILEASADDASSSEVVRDAADASFGDTTILEVIIGNDDRVRLPAGLNRTNPWRQICALRIRAATGKLFVGTGWFIGPQVLATAGHCVFLQKEGGWPDSIEVIPARSGAEEPFGRLTSRRFASVDGWVESKGRDFDYGVIFLDDPDVGTRVGNFQVEAELDSQLNGATGRISGYPADLDRAQFQFFHERVLREITATRLLYDIDTFGGQSGSPVWRQIEGSPATAIGIHTTGDATGNSGTRISEPVLDNLILWNEQP